MGKCAPGKVTPELKTDTCTAGYQPATESLCLGRMCVGQRDTRNGVLEARECVRKKKRIVKGRTE